MFTGIFLCTIVFLISVIYHYKKTYSYWKTRGIPNPPPLPIIGNVLDVALVKRPLHDLLDELYVTNPEDKVVGFYCCSTPVLVLKDYDLIKEVLVKNFENFMDRGQYFDEDLEPHTANMFNLETKRWRPLRHSTSAFFTPKKIREMIPVMIDSGNTLIEYIDVLLEKSNDINCREVATKYFINVIGKCFFGISDSSLTGDDSPLRMAAGKFVLASRLKVFMHRVRMGLPQWLDKIMAPLFVDHFHSEFFVNVTKQFISMRENSDDSYKNLTDLFIALREKEKSLSNDTSEFFSYLQCINN